MTSWTEMTAAEFDATQAPDRKTRQFIATAGETMFPRLMPGTPKRKTTPAPDPMPGEVPLFDL